MVTGKTERSALGELLVEMGLVDREQMASALAQHRTTGARLARILAERRIVDEDRLAKALSARLGLEAVNLSSLKIHERVLAIIPPPVALKYGALPIAIKRTNQAEFVYVVMADPLDVEALGELQRVSGRQIRVLVGTASELDRVLEQHYRPLMRSAEPAPGGTPPRPAAPLPPPSGSNPGQRAEGSRRTAIPTASTGSTPSQSLPAVERRPRQVDPKEAERARSRPEPLFGGHTPPPMPGADRRAQKLPPPPVSQSARDRAAGVPPLAAPPSRPGLEPALGGAPAVPPPASRTPPQPRPLAAPPAPTPQRPLSMGPTRPDAGARTGGAAEALSADATRARPEIGASPRGLALPPLREHDLQPQRPQGSTPLPALPRAPAGPGRTPGAGTALPRAKERDAMRDTLYDAPPAQGLPPRDQRVPGAEEDRTNFDPSVPFALDAIDELGGERAAAGALASGSALGGGEWDLAVRDWERSGASESWRDTLHEGSLNATAAPRALEREDSNDRNEPVTTEAVLADLERAPQPSLAPTTRPSGGAREEVQIEILDAPESTDDMKTSQVDLSEEAAAQIIGVAPVASPRPASPAHARAIAGTLEVPVDFGFGPSPFEGPESAEIPVGLERTGIIPAIDWEREEFVPPPLARSSPVPGLAGTDDIPVSPAAVRARQNLEQEQLEDITIEPPREAQTPDPRPVTILDAPEPPPAEEAPRKRKSDPPQPAEPEPPLLLEELEPEPEPPPSAPEAPAVQTPSGDLAVADDSDSGAMPVIEPSTLVSLMDDDSGGPAEITGHDEGVPYRGRAEAPPAEVATPEPSPAPEAAREPATRLFDERDREREPRKPSRSRPDAAEEDPTNPRIDKSSVNAALAEPRVLPPIEEPAALDGELTPPRDDESSERARALADLSGMLVVGPQRDSSRETMELNIGLGRASAEAARVAGDMQAGLTPRGHSDVPRPAGVPKLEDDARRMVVAMLAGDSLTSAERAQLVLAIGRLLIAKGVLSEEDLVEELRK